MSCYTAALVMPSCADAGTEDFTGRKQRVSGPDKAVSSGFLETQKGQRVRDQVTAWDAKGWRCQGTQDLAGQGGEFGFSMVSKGSHQSI